jgi:hypothetical protein
MFRSYLRLALFAVGLLVGVQVPGAIEQYAQRVDAHRIEAQLALEGFRTTARQFFGGDLDALVAHYRASDDPVFRRDADSLQGLIDRAQLLQAEWQAMQGPWYARALHLALRADPELRAEALASYRYQVLLDPAAIAWGVCSALLLAWLVETLLLALYLMFSSTRQRRRPA